MSRTFKLLEATFPRDLARLIAAYFGTSANLKANARAGRWEACEGQKWSYQFLEGAASSGHLEMVRVHVAQSLVVGDAFKGACQGRHIPVIRFLMPLIDREDGLCAAIAANHIGVVKALLAHGAHNWLRAIEVCCRYDRVRLAKLLVAKGAPIAESIDEAFDWGRPGMIAYALACGGDVKKYVERCPNSLRFMVVKLLLRYKPSAEIVLEIWDHASFNGRLDIVDFILPRVSIAIVMKCMQSSCVVADAAIVRRVLAAYPLRRWTVMFFWAAWSGDPATIAPFIEYDYWTPNIGLIGAAGGLQHATVIDMFARGATSVSGALSEVCSKQQRIKTHDEHAEAEACTQIVRLLMDHGARDCRKCGRPAAAHLT